jgi:hypothetical protein
LIISSSAARSIRRELNLKVLEEPMETASPIDVVSLISAFPESKVLADAEVPLVTIAANRPCVLHLFTG